VGSALGYALGGLMGAHLGWRWAFYSVVIPGLILGVVSLLMKDPPRAKTPGDSHRPKLRDYLVLARNHSYVLNTLGMAALTFAIGGISYWMPRYLTQVRGLPDSSKIVFGGILCGAGLLATLAGGFTGDWLKKRYKGSYFIVSGIAILIAVPFVLLMLHSPFPLAWVWIFFAVFFLFFNTGPSNTILANVTHPSIRASAFALNIFLIHAMGDAPSPPLLGGIAGHYGWDAAFGMVAATMVGAAVVWLYGARYLHADTLAASANHADG